MSRQDDRSPSNLPKTTFMALVMESHDGQTPTLKLTANGELLPNRSQPPCETMECKPC